MTLELAMPGDVRVDGQKLHALGVRTLVAAGIPEEHARLTCDVLLRSDLRGVESHGFARFVDFYVDRARTNDLNTRPDVRVVQDAPSAATIDGDGGLGFVPGTLGMRLAIEKAQSTGVGFVTVRNSTHYGPCSPYALMALEHGMIGIAMTTGGNNVVPPGTAQRVHGLNAMCMVAPARGPDVPFCLDMATSVVAAGKIEIAQRRGKPIPEGWASDEGGTAITEPDVFFDVLGGILPLGGDELHGAWKGFGLTLMVDILSGLLSGGKGSAELPRRAANHFCAAIRIDAFTTLDSFYDQMDSLKATLRAAPRLPGAGELTFPGEPEAAKEADYLSNGIPYHPSVLAGIRAASEALGVPYDLE